MKLRQLRDLSFREAYEVLVSHYKLYREDVEMIERIPCDAVEVGFFDSFKMMFTDRYDYNRHKLFDLNIIKLTDREWYSVTTKEKGDHWTGVPLRFLVQLDKIRDTIEFWNGEIVGRSFFENERYKGMIIKDLVELGISGYADLVDTKLIRDMLKEG